MSSDSGEDDRRRRRRQQDDSDSDSEEASQEHVDPASADQDEAKPAPVAAVDDEPEDVADPETLEEFYAMLKRKRKGRKRIAGAEVLGKVAVAIDIDEVNKSDRDYTYPEMLALVYDCIKGTGAKVRDEPFRLRPPQVARDGSRKVVWVNFPNICQILKRPEEHLFQFALAELGTTGNLNGDHAFVMRGRFTDKHLESLLRKYVQQYVTCQMCRSLDTTINKDSHSRLTTLTCTQCFASRTVNNISSGFSAQIGRRKRKP